MCEQSRAVDSLLRLKIEEQIAALMLAPERKVKALYHALEQVPVEPSPVRVNDADVLTCMFEQVNGSFAQECLHKALSGDVRGKVDIFIPLKPAVKKALELR